MIGMPLLQKKGHSHFLLWGADTHGDLFKILGPAVSLDISTTECCSLQWLGIDMQPMDALIILITFCQFIVSSALPLVKV